MSDKKVVATEVCEAEFNRFCEAMDLDVDPTGMDEEERKGFENAKRKLIRVMETGHLIINDAGEPVYKPQVSGGEPITFHEPTGASYMAMDSKKEGHSVKKGTAALADLTGENEPRFAKMANRDYKICMAVLTLFFGS